MPAMRTGIAIAAGCLAAVCVVVAAPARANDLDVGVTSQVLAGKRPALKLTAHKRVRSVVVRLASNGGRSVVLRPKRLPVGHEVRLPLPGTPGRTRWKGELHVVFRDGTKGAMPLSFETVVAVPMHLSSEATRTDVLAGQATIRADRPVRRVVIEVVGEGGHSLGTTVLPFHAKAGDPLALHWKQAAEGDPLLVRVTVTDTDGFTTGLEWTPWKFDIPHEEVVFDTDQAVIRTDQVPKLTAVRKALAGALAKYGAVAKVRLWIAGHTDTVGPAAHNQRLSEARARAIAVWFRRHGVRVPIAYRGLGESAPKVPTPDETPEPKNRRAEYVVAATDPLQGESLPGSWKMLP